MTTQTSTAAAFTRNSTSATGNAVLTTFPVGFPLKGNRTDVVVKVAGVTKTLGTDYTFSADNTSITFTAAPANAAAVLIYEALSEHASAAVLPNVLETKATVTLADQPARVKATVTENVDPKASYTGDAVTTVFAVPFKVRFRGDVVVTDNGVVKVFPQDFTWAADNSSITFVSAPAAAAAIVIQDTIKTVNVDDVEGVLPAFTISLTRTNH